MRAGPATTLDPSACQAPSEYVDADHPAVVAFADQALAAAGLDPASSGRERAVALFVAVRDGVRYDPYGFDFEPASFKASAVAVTARNWCVPKSILLTAACRAAGIPAALGFADVRNHLQSTKLLAKMGTDVFIYHGYSVIWVEGEWHKVSSAFNRELCERFGTKQLEWDGTGDALMHPYDASGERHMEYVRDRGWFVDVPLEDMVRTMREAYPSMVPAAGEHGHGAADDEPDEMFAG